MPGSRRRWAAGGVLAAMAAAGVAPALGGDLLTGQDALGDWRTDAPGVRRLITPADLPLPNPGEAAYNPPAVAPMPQGALPRVPAGFEANLYAAGLNAPRVIAAAPNGDVFVAESRRNRIRALRDTDGDGDADTVSLYADGLDMPFGLAFYPPGPQPEWLYVGLTGAVVKFRYRAGDLQATGAPKKVVDGIPAGGQLTGGGHWTRDIAFSADGKKMWVSVGSRSDATADDREKNRACIHRYNPKGRDFRLTAKGLRNPAGLAVDPQTGAVWSTCNERDNLGNHLVPDYVTRVRDGDHYGWPWFYIGPNRDPRYPGAKPKLQNRVRTPDVLLQSHTAPLDLAFYTGSTFPESYRGDLFVACHGSWNRSTRTGYKVVRIPIEDGEATGEYEDFLTGFVLDDVRVWGRPVGVAVAQDGALLVSDDAGGRIWRVQWTGGG